MEKKIPMRQCIGCRQSVPKKNMLRIIKTPEGTMEIDFSGKKNGRGAYVCYSEQCLEKAFKNKGLEKSLGLSVPQEVYLELQKELKKFGTK